MPSPTTAATASAAAAPAPEEVFDATKYGYELGNKVVRRYAVSDVHTARKALNDNIEALVVKERGGVRRRLSANTKIVVGIVSIAVGALSHLAPIPFPESVPLIIACIAIYYACCGVLLYISRIVEADSFLEVTFIPQSSRDSSASGAAEGKAKVSAAQSRAAEGKTVRFTASVDRFDPHYKIRAQIVKPSKVPLLASTALGKPIEKTFFFGDFFSERGLVYPPALKAEVSKILKELKVAE
jgi:hypothetical protein